jgi:hypothetical protein
MPRGKRKTPTADDIKTHGIRRGGRRKNGQAGTSSPDEKLAAAEAELVKKYPDRRFKPGSLLPAEATKEFGSKRSIILLCECGEERRVATSDVFHVLPFSADKFRAIAELAHVFKRQAAAEEPGE